LEKEKDNLKKELDIAYKQAKGTDTIDLK